MTGRWVTEAYCLKCDWTATGDRANAQAERHTKDTRHGTVTRSRREGT